MNSCASHEISHFIWARYRRNGLDRLPWRRHDRPTRRRGGVTGLGVRILLQARTRNCPRGIVPGGAHAPSQGRFATVEDDRAHMAGRWLTKVSDLYFCSGKDQRQRAALISIAKDRSRDESVLFSVTAAVSAGRFTFRTAATARPVISSAIVRPCHIRCWPFDRRRNRAFAMPHSDRHTKK